MQSRQFEPVQINRRRLALALPMLACGLVVAPVRASTDIHQASRIVMGTRLDLTLQDEDISAMASAAEAAYAEMTRLEQMMSRYRITSVLNAINLALDRTDKSEAKLARELAELLVKVEGDELLLLQTNHDSR